MNTGAGRQANLSDGSTDQRTRRHQLILATSSWIVVGYALLELQTFLAEHRQRRRRASEIRALERAYAEN